MPVMPVIPAMLLMPLIPVMYVKPVMHVMPVIPVMLVMPVCLNAYIPVLSYSASMHLFLHYFIGLPFF